MNIGLWHLSERDLAGWVGLLLFAFIPLWFWRYRILASRLFVGSKGDEAALEQMREKLEVVNGECPAYLFSATRVATVYLHEISISLIYGFVVPRMGAGSVSKCVFAIADQDQADWMRRYSDVFEPAFSGSPWSIFWVKVPAVLRLIRRGR